VGVVIGPFAGDRSRLDALFALADDSPVAVEYYRELGTLLVARDGGAVVGLALLVPHDAERSELKALAVDPARQGEGLGKRLVEAAVQTARREGARFLDVSTAAADVCNLRFYQRTGFRMKHICRDAFTPATGYPDPIEIDGVLLRDQVLFDQEL
jgi:GNAT superfamily N-acetyltransferase